jgi:hypothetical protein
LARYLAAERGDEGALAAIPTNYHIEWTMLPPQSGAALLLKHLPGWKRLYVDPYVVNRREGSGLKRPPAISFSGRAVSVD